MKQMTMGRRTESNNTQQQQQTNINSGTTLRSTTTITAAVPQAHPPPTPEVVAFPTSSVEVSSVDAQHGAGGEEARGGGGGWSDPRPPTEPATIGRDISRSGSSIVRSMGGEAVESAAASPSVAMSTPNSSSSSLGASTNVRRTLQYDAGTVGGDPSSGAVGAGGGGNSQHEQHSPKANFDALISGLSASPQVIIASQKSTSTSSSAVQKPGGKKVQTTLFSLLKK